MEAIIKDINPSALLAARYGLAGPKDFRTQRTGYYFTKRAGVVYLVTTGAQILIIQRLPNATMTPDSLTIDYTGASLMYSGSALFKKIGTPIPLSGPAAGINRADAATVYRVDDSTALILAGSVALSAEIYTGSAYPDIEQLWAGALRDYHESPAELADFDPALLHTLQRSAKAAQGGRYQPLIKVHHRGNRAALVTSTVEDWAAVIMPMRLSELPLPAWVNDI